MRPGAKAPCRTSSRTFGGLETWGPTNVGFVRRIPQNIFWATDSCTHALTCQNRNPLQVLGHSVLLHASRAPLFLWMRGGCAFQACSSTPEVARRRRLRTMPPSAVDARAFVIVCRRTRDVSLGRPRKLNVGRHGVAFLWYRFCRQRGAANHCEVEQSSHGHQCVRCPSRAHARLTDPSQR